MYIMLRFLKLILLTYFTAGFFLFPQVSEETLDTHLHLF